MPTRSRTVRRVLVGLCCAAATLAVCACEPARTPVGSAATTGSAPTTTTSPVAASTVPTTRSTPATRDSRIIEAGWACVDAVGGRRIPGFGLITAALRGNSEDGLREALIELQLGRSPMAAEAWNAFVDTPRCIALAADLGINPAPVGEGDFGDVSSNFVGGWSGGIVQQNPPIPPFTLTVDIERGRVGSTIATGRYTGTSPCTVHWVLRSADVDRLVVREVVDSGDCFDDVEVTLRLVGGGRLSYDFEDGNGTGLLSRT